MRVSLLLALAWSLVGCATVSLPVLPLGPAVAYVDGDLADRLDLGGRGELYVRPRLLATGYDPGSFPPEDLRLQVVVRAIRTDGGVMSWSVGADGDAPVSEGGRRWRPEHHRGLMGLSLDGARLGPFPIDEIKALEVLAAWRRGPPEESAREQGVRALGAAPGLGDDPRRWAVAGHEIQRLGSAPLVAVRVPLTAERAREPGVHVLRLTLVAPGEGVELPPLLRFAEAEAGASAPWPLDLDGQPLALVILDLEIQRGP